MQLQRFDFAVTEHGGHRLAVNKLHAFFLHVVEIFGHGGHLCGIWLNRDHRDFDRALAQRLARTIDCGVSSADYSDARAQLHFRSTHADVAQEGQTVEHAGFIFTFGTHAVGLGKTDRQYARVIIFLQIVPGDVFADFDVGLNGDAELFETLDFAIKYVLRKNPVRNASAIESARLRRFLEDRDFVAEARELIRRAVTRRARTNDGDFLAVGLAGLDYIVGKRLPKIAEKTLDRTDRNSFVVLAAIAS